MTKPTPKKKKTVKCVVDKREVRRAHMALFWEGHVIAGECRYVARKFPDGLVIFEITYATKIEV